MKSREWVPGVVLTFAAAHRPFIVQRSHFPPVAPDLCRRNRCDVVGPLRSRTTSRPRNSGQPWSLAVSCGPEPDQGKRGIPGVCPSVACLPTAELPFDLSRMVAYGPSCWSWHDVASAESTSKGDGRGPTPGDDCSERTARVRLVEPVGAGRCCAGLPRAASARTTTCTPSSQGRPRRSTPSCRDSARSIGLASRPAGARPCAAPRRNADRSGTSEWRSMRSARSAVRARATPRSGASRTGSSSRSHHGTSVAGTLARRRTNPGSGCGS